MNTTYATIAEAEAVITAAGYVRDSQRHIWVNGSKTAKVVRTAGEGKPFSIEWA